MFKGRNKRTGVAVERPSVALPETGNLLVTGPTGGGKTRLVRSLIKDGYFGDDAVIRVVTDYPGQGEYDRVGERIASVGSGMEAMVAAVGAVRSVTHYRRHLDGAPLSFMKPVVLVLDMPYIIGRMSNSADPGEAARPTLEMLKLVTATGRSVGARVILSAYSTGTEAGIRRGMGCLQWFTRHATTVTVDYPTRREIRIEETAPPVLR